MNKKSSMSYYDLLTWLVENKNELEGCRIDNVYKISGLQAYFIKLHCKTGDRNLIVEPGKRVHFTRFDRQKEITPDVSTIRIHIKDKIIQEVSIVGRERILQIKLNDRILYVELLPRGLLVITDPQNRILFSTEYKEFKDRVIKPNVEYKIPPQPSISNEEIEKLLKKGNISRILGVPQEIIEALGLKATNKEELDLARKKIEEFEENIRNGKFDKCLIPDLTALPIKIENCIEKNSYDEALDEFFTNEEKNQIKSEIDKKLEEERAKLLKTIQEVENEIKKYEEEEERNRNIANLIISNYEMIQNKINEQIQKKNLIKVEIYGQEIEIDPKLSVYKNASKYFDIAKEYSEKAKKAKETLENLKVKLQELDKQLEERKEEIKISMRKKEWYEKYRWSYTRNGFLIIAGRDVDQNESIVKKLLNDNDIFLHADIQGAAATIIKTEGRQVNEEDLQDAAALAACYSKGWKGGMGAIDVFWVYGNQVSKSPPSGEYLKKGSFMIYGKKNFIKNVKLQLALGLTSDFKIIVGSEEVVKKYSGYPIYFIIAPGDEDISKLALKIAKILQEKLNLKGVKVLQEDIARALPGKSTIVAIKNKSQQEK